MSGQIAILGLLVEQSLHGYAIEQLIEARGMRDWTPIGFSSIYQLLDRLVADGLAEVEIEAPPGRGRERRVHHVTPAGRRLWVDKALWALEDVDSGTGDFLMALSGLPLLDRDEVTTVLGLRVAHLETRIDDLDRDRAAARPAPEHVEAMFDYIHARLVAERDWAIRFLSQPVQEDTP